MNTLIHVELPASLGLIARADRHVALSVPAPVTQRRILDALEALYPVLRGTIRDQSSQVRRPFIRFFACKTDLSHEPPDDPLPPGICDGTEMFLIVAAIAGG
ncbi:MAG: hypothetical protein B7Z78_03080 [Rhodospirillales bacterium 20-60-12]|nr:MAG: hypothetical protein B7Z78_03080 [Rhodospirillales bacterium 20-60-12]HQT66360.1 hypothetical protein [Acetobacteraceae bacterium]HQU02365.1 hypothetical protein [Acetobacteraceae bacterium]